MGFDIDVVKAAPTSAPAMGLSGLLASGASLIGDGLTAWLGHEEAQNAQAFSERMASTQYQRTVKDLLAAGLNPMLAYMNTNAAPSSAAAAVPHIGSGAASAFSSVHSAKAAANLADEQAKLPVSQRNLIDDQAAAARSQDSLNSALAAKAREDAKVSIEQASLTAAEARSAEAEALFNEMIFGAARALGPGAGLTGKLLDLIPDRKGRGRAPFPFPPRGK